MTGKSPQAPASRPGGQPLQPALLDSFGPDCLAPEACARLLARLLNPHGLSCPACGRVAEPSPRLLAGGRARCTGCGRRFTAFSGTLMAGCKLPPHQVALMLLLLALGHDNATVAALARVSAETARAWRAKLEAA